MAHATLTDVFIRSIQPDPLKQVDFWDGRLPGFGVRVSPSGTKAFQVLYRIGRRSRRFTIGRYPILSLSDARKAAQAALRDVTLGKDPAADRAGLRRDPHAFDEFIDTYILTYAKQKNKSWADTERLLKREFVKVWGKRDIRLITKRDVNSVLDSIVKRDAPSLANHALAVLRKVFNWAVERDALLVSPCQGLKAPSATSSRERVLNDVELARVWVASGKVNYPYGPFVRMLILTAQRRGEVAGMRWSQIDLAKAVWSLPSKSTKSKRAHEVPLTLAAMVVLRSIPRTQSDLVFSTSRNVVPIGNFNRRKNLIDRVSLVSNWTLHDIRRTVATGMAGLKVDPHVVERILNHAIGSLGKVAAIYNRFGYLDEMRDALTKWSQHVESLTVG